MLPAAHHLWEVRLGFSYRHHNNFHAVASTNLSYQVLMWNTVATSRHAMNQADDNAAKASIYAAIM